MGIKAITFDFWGTLFFSIRSPKTERGKIIRTALADHGLFFAAEDISNSMKRAWLCWDDTWIGEQRTAGSDTWLQTVLTDLGAELPEEIRKRTELKLERIILRGTAAPVSGALEAVKRAGQRYRLGIISDTGISPGKVLRELLERSGILSFFKVLIFSDEFGRSKPHPSIFRSALKVLGVPAEEAVHIGDLRRTDIVGAKKVGMHQIRYAGTNNDVDCAYSDADVVMENYKELQTALERIENGN